MLPVYNSCCEAVDPCLAGSISRRAGVPKPRADNFTAASTIQPAIAENARSRTCVERHDLRVKLEIYGLAIQRRGLGGSSVPFSLSLRLVSFSRSLSPRSLHGCLGRARGAIG